MKTIPDEKLLAILGTKRPHGSYSEAKFIREHLDSVPGMRADRFGNRYLRLGDSATMFSSHTDTVHSSPGYQRVRWESKDGGIYSLADKSPVRPTKKNQHDFFKEMAFERTCLGADDGAGIWIMLHMIEREIPGLYVFHRGEEVGGLGSDYIATTTPDFVNGIERCIAIDRRGQTDVITHQMCGRCCSDAFANALCVQLGMKHEPCDGGTFTDSANYVDLIPECTNISAGYLNEHTRHETLSQRYLSRLLDAMCQVDWEGLPTNGWWADLDSDDNYDYEFLAEGYTGELPGAY